MQSIGKGIRRALFINAFILSFGAMAAVAAPLVARSTAAHYSTDDQTTLNTLCLRTRQSLPRGARVPGDVCSRLAAAMPGLSTAEIDALTGNISLCLAKMPGGPLSAGQRGASGSAGNSGSESSLMSATQQMQETQMSFNLQYLQLQSAMQNENRSFTVVSNLMKTKHDMVKNSLSNIR